jgi:hypothetical protein
VYEITNQPTNQLVRLCEIRLYTFIQQKCTLPLFKISADFA